MSTVYARYLEQLKQSNPIELTEQDQTELDGSIGGKILEQKPTTFMGLFDVFNSFFANGRWSWKGSVGFTASRVAEVLDGTRSEGECKMLAAALVGLWSYPSPFGLGQGGASLSSFDGGSPDGFLAHHPVEGIHGLKPNIMHPHSAQGGGHLQPLYQWGNHKVASYNGVFYDPSYRTTYPQMNSMMAFQFIGAAAGENYRVRVVTPNDQRGWRTGQDMFMCFSLASGGWKGPYRAVDPVPAV